MKSVDDYFFCLQVTDKWICHKPFLIDSLSFITQKTCLVTLKKSEYYEMSFPLICQMSIRRISQRAKDEKTRKLLSRIIRVDQAGELGADRIYAGQIAVLGNTPVGPIIQVCYCRS